LIHLCICYNDNTGKIQKGKDSKIKLNNKCLIIIDEAQDLDSKYIYAFEELINKTGIDLYIIGDKLQSILTRDNVFTHYLKKSSDKKNVIYNSGVNQVKRFHNIKLKDLVNNHIDYHKYGLQEIEKICENNKCNIPHEDENPSYNIFEIPEIYMNDYDDDKINKVIQIIVNGMNHQIKENGYVPNNFMFIFPMIKNNYLARILEERIQQFWINKFDDNEYIEKVLKKNEYWKNKLDKIKYNKFVYLHFSVDGKPINLEESKYMTRMVSIHASKGDGREVVFLLGLSEYSLSIYNGDKYSKEKDNLIYESLLHVALTRQKKFIYLGLIRDNGDIWNRFNKDCDIEKFTDDKKNNLNKINKKHKLKKIIDYVLNNDEIFNKFNKIIIDHKIKLDEIWNNKKNNTIIDWGHHIIRNSVFRFNIMSNLLEYKNIYDQDYKTKEFVIDYNPHQFIKKLDYMSNKNILCCDWNKYNKTLQDITNYNKDSKNKRDKNIELDINKIQYIPILQFSNLSKNSMYNKYIIFLNDSIENIQKKIIENFKKEQIPFLCPLESVIYYYCRDILDNGIFYDEPTIMSIYDIIYHMDNFNSDEIHTDNIKYDCICNNFFKNNNKDKDNKLNNINNSISNSYALHYKQVENVKTLIEEYRVYINTNNIEQKTLESKRNTKKNAEEIKYNEDKFLELGKKEDECDKSSEYVIYNQYDLIGSNYKYIINHILVPQFSKLTYNDIFMRMIFEQYIIKSNNSDVDKKNIIHCIFSLDNNEPYFYNENELCNEEINNLIEEVIQKYIIEENNKYYEYIFEYYQEEISKTNFYQKSFEKLYEELKNIECKKIKGNMTLQINKIPTHILTFMDEKKSDIEKIKNKSINKEDFDNKFKMDESTNILLNKDKFKKQLNDKFIKSICKQINNNEEY